MGGLCVVDMGNMVKVVGFVFSFFVEFVGVFKVDGGVM